ncbi:MAG: hypothetical protein JEY97_09635 [Bacteroidales bacterium]|nr:hypothetical protein [Bacteroidales bacterium]
MKKFYLFSLIVILGVLTLVILNDLPDEISKKEKDSKFKIHDPHALPNDWMAYQRAYPHNKIKLESYLSSMNQASEMHKKAAKIDGGEWEFAGPTNIGGRITDIAIHPDDLDTWYIGAASGGILKTTDAGQNWENIFMDVPVISIGDLCIDPNNDQVIYAGTGEANASSYSFLGAGIYKSTNAGETWEFSGLENSAYIGRIIVGHDNSERIFAAACGDLFTSDPNRGVYRSIDGGENWDKVLFVNDSTSAVDLIQHPTNPDIIYATMWERMRGLTYRRSFGNGSGVWKTTDGGDSWTELTNGLPTGNNVGRIGIDLCKSNPDVLYTFYDMTNQDVRVYKSTNGGNSWVQTNDGTLDGMCSSFGWYFGQVRVDPNNENNVFVMGVYTYKTTNGGSSWSETGGYSMHVDHHAMYIDENTGLIVEGNDGGLYKSTNGSSWNKINNIPLTQFYYITFDFTHPERIYGGTQDNNTIRTMTGNVDDWEVLIGGDGMYCLVDYENNNNIFAEMQNGSLYKSEDGGYDFDYIANSMSGDRTNWSSPYIMHPVNPEILYFGTYRVWKTTNGGNSWNSVSSDLTKGGSNTFHTLTALAISPIDPEIVLAGSGDAKVHVSTNGGGGWDDISEGLPDRWITRVACDPNDVNTIYATVSGFRWDEPQAHVFKSTNLGQDWIDISGNLPDMPVNIIKIDPEYSGRYFIGTDAGIFFTTNGGESWESMNQGLPNVPVTCMEIDNNTRTLLIGTYGISCYKINLDQLGQEIDLSEGFQFVSTRILLDEADMMTVLENNLNDNLVFVRNSNGEMLRKIGPNWVNGIGDWITTEGYLFKMNAADLLTFQGSTIDPLTAINLFTGYQFVSYLPAVTIDAFVAFQNILNENLAYIRDSEGKILRKIGPNWVNGIGNANPGQGYLVKMFANDELVYNIPVNNLKKSTTKKTLKHFNFKGGNAADPVYTIYVDGLQIGDEVAIFDNEKIVGAGLIISENVLENGIPVFSTLFSGKGYEAGNKIIIKIWDKQSQTILPATYIFNREYSKAYTKTEFPSGDGEYSVINVSKGNIENDNLVSTKVNVYPNPASNYLVISGCDGGMISIAELGGKPLKKIRITGENCRLDISDLKNNTYLMIIDFNNKITYKKIIVVK